MSKQGFAWGGETNWINLVQRNIWERMVLNY